MGEGERGVGARGVQLKKILILRPGRGLYITDFVLVDLYV